MQRGGYKITSVSNNSNGLRTAALPIVSQILSDVQSIFRFSFLAVKRFEMHLRKMMILYITVRDCI